MPDDPLIPVINAETGGDGIAERLAATVEVIIVKRDSAQSDEADDHADFNWFLSAIRRRSFPFSRRLRESGLNATKKVRLAQSDFGLGVTG